MGLGRTERKGKEQHRWCTGKMKRRIQTYIFITKIDKLRQKTGKVCAKKQGGRMTGSKWEHGEQRGVSCGVQLLENESVPAGASMRVSGQISGGCDAPKQLAAGWTWRDVTWRAVNDADVLRGGCTDLLWLNGTGGAHTHTHVHTPEMDDPPRHCSYTDWSVSQFGKLWARQFSMQETC